MEKYSSSSFLHGLSVMYYGVALVLVFQHQSSNIRLVNGQYEGVQAGGFVQTRGSQFVVNGSTFNFNGFNAYWMMVASASNQSNSSVNVVATVLHQAAQHGLTVGRTWAFSDGGSMPLQSAPGVYNEAMFKALDSVIFEAGKNGIRLIATLVNNYGDFGGRPQYVRWAKERGQTVNSDDDFYTNDVIRGYYRNHISKVVSRVNSITNVSYMDDPTIFAWELINEPRCQSDLSGKTFQRWVVEMAAYLKSLDKNHLVAIGEEGFYGPDTPARVALNPGGATYGTDFVADSLVPHVDFATFHAYPDLWLKGQNETVQKEYLWKWATAHIFDTIDVVKKPLVLGEFGKSSLINNNNNNNNNNNAGHNAAASNSPAAAAAAAAAAAGDDERDIYFGVAYDAIYLSAEAQGPLAGGLFWQLGAPGNQLASDGYQVILPTDPSTSNLILHQSQRMSKLNTIAT